MLATDDQKAARKASSKLRKAEAIIKQSDGGVMSSKPSAKVLKWAQNIIKQGE